MSGDRAVRPTCVVCGDVLGVYEPVIVVGAGQPPRRTSRAAEGRWDADVTAMHEQCYEPGAPPGHDPAA